MAIGVVTGTSGRLQGLWKNYSRDLWKTREKFCQSGARGLNASFHLGDFVEPALVATAQIGGREEGLDHFQGGFGSDDTSAEGEDVGVIVFACQAGGVDVVGEGGADPWDFIGRDGDADSGATNGDTEIGLFGGDAI